MQNLPQPMRYPSFSAMAVPTTLAEAPMGVALPPMSVPRASVQAMVSRSRFGLADRLLMTGTMVAAKGMLSTMAEAKAEIFKALGHPSRLTMVEALGKGPRCVCDLVEMVPGSQPTISRHLDVLLKAGVVRRRREGVKMIYELATPCILRTLPCVTEAIRRRISSQAEVLGE